jgi:thioredoxin reductase
MTDAADAVVIGGGPAGLSAALMLGRARRRVVVVDGGAPRNRVTAHAHGILGRDGIAPLDLLAEGRADLARYDAEMREGDVASVVRDDGGFAVRLDGGARIAARTVVVATGLRDVLPDIPGLAELWGRGVAGCPYCDGWEVRGRRIAVLATGPGSMHQVQLLRQWSDDLVYLAGADGVPDAAAEAALIARGIRTEREPVARVHGADGLTGVTLTDGREIPLDAIFTAPRLEPRDAVLVELGAERREVNGIGVATVDFAGRTSVPGLYAVGNVVDPFANVPVSMGQGAWVGGAVNGDLVLEEFAAAVASADPAATGPTANPPA